VTALPGFSGDCELLAPAIFDLAVDERTDELGANGDFGSREGVVQLKGNNLTIKSWDSYGMVCDLPRDGQRRRAVQRGGASPRGGAPAVRGRGGWPCDGRHRRWA
jgi:hypothetical protein